MITRHDRLHQAPSGDIRSAPSSVPHGRNGAFQRDRPRAAWRLGTRAFFACLIVSAVPRLAATQVTEQWVARYDGPGQAYDSAFGGLAVDALGDVYVTGSSAGVPVPNQCPPYDYAIVKYRVDGLELWVARYDGLAHGEDDAWGLALDLFGSVHVTGASSSNCGANLDLAATVRYSSGGVEEWVASDYTGGGGSVGGRPIGPDGSGNVFVTMGTSFGPPGDIVVLKYSSAGALLWTRTYNGPGNNRDYPRALAVDGAGNVYVTGESSGSTSLDFVTLKYAPDGGLLWEKRYASSGNSVDRAYAIALDAAGNAYVTGESKGDQQDYTTVKYSSAGTQLWVRKYNGRRRGNDIPNAIAVDASGNAYVTGVSDGSTSADYATVKYATDGTQLWVARYNGPGNGEDKARAIAVDGSGGVYVTGWSAGSGSSLDYLTLKYGGAGGQLWQVRYNGPGNGNDFAHDVAVGADGLVYVTGGSQGVTNQDFATIQYAQ